VTITRPAREFSSIRGAGRTGFTLTGSGTGAVTTPAFYPPRSLALVTISGAQPFSSRRVRVARTGRLSLQVPLGPGNPAQQSTVGAQTREYSTSVRISAPRRQRR
jgi:hypothetical protein